MPRTYRLGLLAALVALTAGRVDAQTAYTWTGGADPDPIWSAPGNWDANGVPASSASDQLVFDGGTNLAPVLDIGTGEFLTNGLTFAGTAGGFTLNSAAGQSLTLGGANPFLAQASTADQRVALALSIDATAGLATLGGTGAGTLTLDALTVRGGGLDVTRNVTAGGGPNAALTLGAFTAGTGGLTIAAGAVLSLRGDIALGDASSGDIQVISGPGTIDLGAGTRTITDLGGRASGTFVDANIAAAFTGAGGLTLDLTQAAGSDKWVALSGANQYLGATTITLDSSYVYLGRENALPTGTHLTLNAVGDGTGRLALGVAMSEAGLTAGNYSQSVASLSGTGSILTDPDAESLSPAAALLTIGNSAGVDAVFGGSIEGTGGVAKVGSNTQTFAGANTYTGGTAVGGGTLRVNGNSSAATGAVSVGTGATLGGTGTLGGAVTIHSGGTLRPGAGTGTLTTGTSTFTVTNAVTLNSGAVFAWDLANSTGIPTGAANSGASSVAGGQTDLVILGSGHTLTAGAVTFRITELSPPTFTPGQSYSWVVATTAGSPTLGAVTFDLSAAPTFQAHGGAAALSLTASGTNVYLNFTPVPEPAGLVALAAAGLAATYRRFRPRPTNPMPRQ